MESTARLLAKGGIIGIISSNPEIAYLLEKTCAGLFWDDLETLDNIQDFYDLHQEIQGDVSKISDTETARKLYGSFPALKLVMRLRELYRRKHYKGIVSRGKITTVQFGSNLSNEEDSFLEENLHKLKQLRGAL